jgi:Mn-dependent DtxR family transcriptional regulator
MLEANGRVQAKDVAEGLGVSTREAGLMLQGLTRAGILRWSKPDRGFIAGEKFMKAAVQQAIAAERAGREPDLDAAMVAAREPVPTPDRLGRAEGVPIRPMRPTEQTVQERTAALEAQEAAPAPPPPAEPAKPRRTATGEPYAFEYPARRGPATEAALGEAAQTVLDTVRAAGPHRPEVPKKGEAPRLMTLETLRERLVDQLGEGGANAAIREAVDRGLIKQDPTTKQFYDPRPVLEVSPDAPLEPRTARSEETWTHESRAGSLPEGAISKLPVLPDGAGAAADAGLTPAQSKIQAEVNRRVEADPEWYVQEYIRRNSKNGTIELNADEARELFPEYAETLQTRSANAPAVHEASSWIVKQAFQRTLAAIRDGKVPDDKAKGVLFMAGAPGSGKTTASRQVPHLVDKAFAIFDGTMAGKFNPDGTVDASKPRDLVAQTLQSGGRADIIYIHGGEPGPNFKRTLDRALGKGRAVQAPYFAQAYPTIPQVNLKIREWLGEGIEAGKIRPTDVTVHVVDNAGAKAVLVGGGTFNDTAGVSFLRGLEYKPEEVSSAIRKAASEWAAEHADRPDDVGRVLRGAALGELVGTADVRGGVPGGRGAGRTPSEGAGRAPERQPEARPEPGVAEPQATPDNQALALRVARENAGRVTSDMLQQEGLDAPTARKVIRSLEVDGLVKFNRNQADYRLTTEGKAAVAPPKPARVARAPRAAKAAAPKIEPAPEVPRPAPTRPAEVAAEVGEVPEGKTGVRAEPMVSFVPKPRAPKSFGGRYGTRMVELSSPEGSNYWGDGTVLVRGATPKVPPSQLDHPQASQIFTAAEKAAPATIVGWSKGTAFEGGYGKKRDVVWIKLQDGRIVASAAEQVGHIMSEATRTAKGKRGTVPELEWRATDDPLPTLYAFKPGETQPFGITSTNTVVERHHPTMTTEGVIPAAKAKLPPRGRTTRVPPEAPAFTKKQAESVADQIAKKFDVEKEGALTIKVPDDGTLKLEPATAQRLHKTLTGEFVPGTAEHPEGFVKLPGEKGWAHPGELKPLRPLSGAAAARQPAREAGGGIGMSATEQALQIYGQDPLRAWTALRRQIDAAERNAKAFGEQAETGAGYEALGGVSKAAAKKLGLDDVPPEGTPAYEKFVADAEAAVAKARADFESGKGQPVNVDAYVKGRKKGQPEIKGPIPPLSGRFVLVNEKGVPVDTIAGKPLNTRGDAERAAEAYQGIRKEKVSVVDRRASEAGAVSVELLAAPILLPAKLVGSMVTMGARLLKSGLTSFGPWAREMASRLGGLLEGGTKSLRHLWEWSRNLFGGGGEPPPGGGRTPPPGEPPVAPPLGGEGPAPRRTPPPYGIRDVVEPTRGEARAAAAEAATRQGPLRPETPAGTDFPINTTRLGGPTELRETQQRLADAFKGTLNQNREYRSWEEARHNWLKSGRTEADFKRVVREQGVVDDATIEGGRALMNDAAERFQSARSRMEEARKAGDDIGAEAAEREMISHALNWGAITAHRVAASAEVARALNIHKKLSAGLTPEERMFQQIVQSNLRRNLSPKLLDELSRAVLEKDHAKMQKLGREILKPSFLDKVNEWFINNILSAPPTWGANVAGNWGHEVLLRTPERGLSGLIEAALARGQGRAPERLPGEAFEALKGQWKHGFGAKHFTQVLRDTLSENPFDPTMMAVKGEYRPPALPGTFGKVWRTPGRLLRALDKAARSAAYEAEVFAETYRDGFNAGRAKGLQGKELRDFINQNGQQLGTQMAEWRRIDLQRQLAGDASLSAAERAILNDPKLSGMGERAAEAAKQSTFQDQVGAFTGAALHLRATHPWLTLFVPFISTPSRILSQAMARTPLGLARAAKRAYTGETRGGAAADELARGLWGSMIGASLYGLAQSGFITGSGPTDPDEQRAWQRTGKQPYAVKVGDNWVSMARLEPMATILGLAADLSEAKDAKKAGDVADKLVATLTNNVMSKSYLDGVASLVEAVQDPERYGSTYAKKMIGAMAVPNLLATAARAIDPTIRDTSQMELPGGLGYIVPPIMARVPGLSQQLPSRLSGTGEPVQREEGPFSRFFSPFRYTKEKGSEADLERAFLRAGYIPSAPTREITIPGTYGRKATLTRQEREIYGAYNARATAQARRLAASLEFENLQPEHQEYVLKSLYRMAHDAARKAVLRSVASRLRA